MRTDRIYGGVLNSGVSLIEELHCTHLYNTVSPDGAQLRKISKMNPDTPTVTVDGERGGGGGREEWMATEEEEEEEEEEEQTVPDESRLPVISEEGSIFSQPLSLSTSDHLQPNRYLG